MNVCCGKLFLSMADYKLFCFLNYYLSKIPFSSENCYFDCLFKLKKLLLSYFFLLLWSRFQICAGVWLKGTFTTLVIPLTKDLSSTYFVRPSFRWLLPCILFLWYLKHTLLTKLEIACIWSLNHCIRFQKPLLSQRSYWS